MPQQLPCYQGLTHPATVLFGARNFARCGVKAAFPAPDVANRQRKYLPERPMTMPIADAAMLAAGAPDGGVLDPTDESVEAAYLDLREDRPSVALSKLKLVGAAFGPSLYVQERLRLIIACGETAPATAAAALLGSPSESGLLIATVRGEDLLGRLEELMQAGCDLGKPPLRDESRSPIAAWAPAGASVVTEALAAGARVVVSRFVTPEDAALATTSESLGEPSTAPPTRTVSLRFVKGYTVNVWMPCKWSQAFELRDFAQSLVPTQDGGIEVTDRNALMFSTSSRKLESLQEIARRLELATPTGSLDEPIFSRIRAIVEERHTAIPSELLEFGYDLRSASEWLGG